MLFSTRFQAVRKSLGLVTPVVEGTLMLQALASTSSGTLNCGTNNNRLVIAFSYGAYASAITITSSPTVGGVSMTQLAGSVSTTAWANSGYANSVRAIYYYKAVGTGNQTVVTQDNSGGVIGTLFIALSGVHATNYLGTYNATIATSTAQSASTTDAVAGDLVLGSLILVESSTPSTALVTGHGTNQTNVLLNAVSRSLGVTDTKVATGSAETISFTLSSSKKATVMTLPIHPA